MTNQDTVQAEYRCRFSALAEYRKSVWRVLCRSFFSKYIPATASVLDVGCGWGEFINNIEAARKHAIDLNPDSRSHVDPDVKFLHQDCSALWNLPSGTLDIVFTSNFLEHLPSKEQIEKIIDGAYRCLDRGGKFICMGPNIKHTGGSYWDFWDHTIPLTESSVVEILKVKGFEIELCYPRFLPYSMSTGRKPNLLFVWLYIKMPFIWQLFGKQFLVIARKPMKSGK